MQWKWDQTFLNQTDFKFFFGKLFETKNFKNLKNQFQN
jgi:hypothetical protein